MSTKLALAFLGATIAAKFLLNWVGIDIDPVHIVLPLTGAQ